MSALQISERWWRLAWLLALLLHVVWLVLTLPNNRMWLDDSVQYATLAEHLRTEGHFSLSYTDAPVPTAERLPGYPLLLSLFWPNPEWVILLQHLMVLGIGLLIYRIARRYTGHARLITLAYLFQPYPLLFASFLMPEVLFMLLVVWAAERYLSHLHRPSTRKLLAASTLLCLATLTKGLALPLLILLLLHASWRLLRWRYVLAISLPMLLLLGGWSLRNQLVLNTPGLTRGTHTAFWYGRLGGMLALKQDCPATDANLIALADSFGRQALDEQGLTDAPLYTFVTERRALESAELHPAAAEVGRRYVLTHPLLLTELHARTFLQMAKGVGFHSAVRQTHRPWLAVGLAGIQLGFNALMLLALLSALVLWRVFPLHNTLLLAIISVFILLHAAIWADGRYRLIADPFFVLLLPNLLLLINRLVVRVRYRPHRRA